MVGEVVLARKRTHPGGQGTKHVGRQSWKELQVSAGQCECESVYKVWFGEEGGRRACQAERSYSQARSRTNMVLNLKLKAPK